MVDRKIKSGRTLKPTRGEAAEVDEDEVRII
jgi:hypothetical protein